MCSSPTTPIGTGCNCSSSTCVRTLLIGRPIGSSPGFCQRVTSHDVTSTVVSVGPYAFTSCTRSPTHCCHAANRSGAALSPPMIIKRSCSGIANCSSANPAASSCQYAVGSSSTVSSHSRHFSMKNEIESSITSVRSTKVVPWIRQGKISSAATSKLIEVNCSTRSLVPSSKVVTTE